MGHSSLVEHMLCLQKERRCQVQAQLFHSNEWNLGGLLHDNAERNGPLALNSIRLLRIFIPIIEKGKTESPSSHILLLNSFPQQDPFTIVPLGGPLHQGG